MKGAQERGDALAWIGAAFPFCLLLLKGGAEELRFSVGGKSWKIDAGRGGRC